MKITLTNGIVIEGTQEELAEYIALSEDFAKVDSCNACEDACCQEDEAETIEFEGAQYRKVDREAREGDVVIITHNNGLLPSWYTLGRKYKVIEGGQIFDNDGDVQGVYSEDCGRTRETIDVYEPVLSAEEAKWAKIGRKVNEFKKGDVVQVEAKGKKRLYTVTQAVGNSVYFDCDLYGSKEEWNHAHDMTLVAPVESLFQH